MDRYYFDVTDIVYYARHNKRVSGIQRVLLNLIDHIQRERGGDVIRCLLRHPEHGGFVEFSAEELLVGREFDGANLLWRLGLAHGSGRMPSLASRKEYLARFDHNKLARSLQKLRIALLAAVHPAGLRRLGLAPQAPPGPSRRLITLHDVPSLPAGATLVILGANWSFTEVHAFAQAHAERGHAVVQMVYDLIPIEHPEFVDEKTSREFRAWIERALRYSTALPCISAWTARQLNQFAAGRPGSWHIGVVALAHEFQGFARDARVEAESAAAQDAGREPFVLCVGTIEIRKNGAALLRAWSTLSARLGPRLPRLVFAGKQGWLLAEFRRLLAGDPALAQRVVIVDAPSDRDLAFLYQRCLFTVFPSRSEGWGLPVGESAWFGKYCIASNASSIPEVCGDCIDYVDPADDAALTAAVERAITDPAYLASRTAVLASMPMRTWKTVAHDLQQFIESSRPGQAPAVAAH